MAPSATAACVRAAGHSSCAPPRTAGTVRWSLWRQQRLVMPTSSWTKRLLSAGTKRWALPSPRGDGEDPHAGDNVRLQAGRVKLLSRVAHDPELSAIHVRLWPNANTRKVVDRDLAEPKPSASWGLYVPSSRPAPTILAATSSRHRPLVAPATRRAQRTAADRRQGDWLCGRAGRTPLS